MGTMGSLARVLEGLNGFNSASSSNCEDEIGPIGSLASVREGLKGLNSASSGGCKAFAGCGVRPERVLRFGVFLKGVPGGCGDCKFEAFLFPPFSPEFPESLGGSSNCGNPLAILALVGDANEGL